MDKNIRFDEADEIKETLHKQLQLLAERSEMTHDELALVALTSEMRELAQVLVNVL